MSFYGLSGRRPNPADVFVQHIAQRIQQAVPRPPHAWGLSFWGGRGILVVGIDRGNYVFKMHKSLLVAPPDIQQRIVDFFVAVLRYNKSAANHASKLVGDWTNNAPEALASRARKRSWKTARSDGLDLNDLYEAMVKTHIWGTRFEQAGVDWWKPKLTWGTPRKSKHRIELGKYNAADDSIVIHGNMQDPRVPGFVIADVMWHEMMHFWQWHTGKRLSHDEEFQADEALASMHQTAKAWLDRDYHHNLRFVMTLEGEPRPLPQHLMETLR